MLAHILKKIIPKAVFPGDAFASGKVRVVLADCNYDDQSLGLDAGFAWARRHLAKSKEPVMIVGYDREKTVRKRIKIDLLDVSGVGYVRLPARVEEIRKKVDELRKIKPEGLDSRSVERNVEEFQKELRSFWHEIKNIILALNSGINGLEKAGDHKERCIEYNILKKQAPDLISSKNFTLSKYAAAWKENQSLIGMKDSLNKTKILLTDAEDIYTRLRNTLISSCTEYSCAAIVEIGKQLTAKLSLIGPQIDKMAPKVNKKGLENK